MRESSILLVCVLQVLPHDSKARRLFVTTGGLKKVQEIKAEPGSALQEYINAINTCYPEEIVRFITVLNEHLFMEKWNNRLLLMCIMMHFFH